MIVRPETDSDIGVISELIQEAFAETPYSNGKEANILEQLRREDELTLSLVAELDGKIVGQVAFSPVRISETDGSWFGLGPVAVGTAMQRQGVGTTLIEQGHKMLIDKEASGCVLIGDPEYYQRFGYRSGNISYADVPVEYVQWVTFSGIMPKGNITYSKAFTDHA